MKIENPQEMAALVAKADEQAAKIVELEAAQAEFETTKTELETTKASLAEVTTEVEALRKENTEFKEAIDATENVGEQVKAEVAKNVELVDKNTELAQKLETAAADAQKKFDEYEAHLIEAKEQSDAFAELAAEYAKDKEKVQDQFALIGGLLGKKALVPDVENTTPANDAPQSYETWLKLANSKNSEDRRMARRLKADNPDIDAFIQKQSETSATVTPATKSFTPEQVAVYNQWKALRAEAEDKKWNGELRATNIKEARRLYKQHQSVIDAQINAAQAA